MLARNTTSDEVKLAYGALKLFLLEALQVGAATVGEIVDISMRNSKPFLYRKIHGMPEHRMHRPILEDRVERLRYHQAVSKALYKLKAEGFVTASDHEWKRTGKGKQALEKLQMRPTRHFTPAPGAKELKIITFDIPERSRALRDWLRAALRNLGMTKLQQSVWAGSVALPEEFFEALRRLHLLSHVEIFAATKSGTLKQLR